MNRLVGQASRLFKMFECTETGETRCPAKGLGSGTFVCFLLLFFCLHFESAAFNFDRQTDLLWQHQLDGSVGAWMLINGFVYQNSAPIQPASSKDWRVAATGDFDHDGETDLLWRDHSGQIAVWLMWGRTPTRFITLKQTAAPVWKVVGSGDFNGDGHTDIVWRHTVSNSTEVWCMEGAESTNFVASIPIQRRVADTNWVAVATEDFNHDSHTDVVWRDARSGNVRIGFMRGTTETSSGPIEPPPGRDYQLSATGPFNRLGKIDLVWRHTGNPPGPDKLWFMDGGRHLSTTNFIYTNGVEVVVADTNYVMIGTGDFNTERILSATNLSDAEILLTWRYGNTEPVTLERSKVSQPDWSTLARKYRPLRFTNAVDVAPGERYEFRLHSGLRASKDYILVGNKAHAIEKRGRVLLLVDETLSSNSGLRSQLAILEQDLAGDGYQVVQNYRAQRHDEALNAANPRSWGRNPSRIAFNKRIITDFYNEAKTETNFVLLIGHAAIPHSGAACSDGHPDHMGAWVADSYYADIDSHLWRDSSSTDYVDRTFPGKSNCSFDGRFDNDDLPSNLELAVGRIDFARLPAFKLKGETETQAEIRLLIQYLKKNHRYRHNIAPFPLPQKAIVESSFADSFGPHSIFDNALRLSSRSFGLDPSHVMKGDLFASRGAGHLWGLFSGAGLHNRILRGYVSATGQPIVRTAEELAIAANEPRIGFYMLHGSYFANWNLVPNNLLRAVLATPDYGLAAVGSSSGSGSFWRFEPLALGEPIGIGILHTVRVTRETISVDRWTSLLGDPTLRLQVTSPPSDPRWGNSTLSWTPPPEDGPAAGDVDYLVEWSSDGLTGTWHRLALTPKVSIKHEMAGSRTYRVRARRLVFTGSGSYYNLSQAIFYTVRKP
ncbi:MAG: hypothetical protein FJ403_04755 [Verrucomicrobia bacterium]|nr:hypothetical protein [Verrucomicrobiota bacterium]